MALDEPKNTDEQLDKDGIKFLIAPDMKTWINSEKKVFIEFNENWREFSVKIKGQSCC